MTAPHEPHEDPTSRRQPDAEPPALRARAARPQRARRPSADGWRRVQSVVDAVPESILVMAGGGELELTNTAADRLFADRPVVDRADLLSRFEPIVVDPPEPATRTARPETPGDGVIVRQRNRPNRWFSLRTVPLDETADGDATEPPSGSETAADPAADRPLAFVLRDVTDTRDLRPLREAFLGLVSHELRTPITTIYAGSTVLARALGLSTPASRTLARDVSLEAARLYDVVEDLLAIGRIERGILEPLDLPVHVGPAIGSTIRIVTGRYPAIRIRRRGPTTGPAVRGDATELDQAIRDLVLAIVRRPGQAADATLDIETQVDRDQGEVRVVVSDDGPPIAPTELETAFDLAGIGPTTPPLAGIGPYVARQLIEAMGGTVWAKDRPGGAGLEVGLRLRMA
jgi:signal transduction histidine kinase